MQTYMPKLGAALQAVALSLLWSMGVGSAATYTFTTLDFPGVIDTEAYGVNDRGQVAGAYRGAGFVWHGFVYQGGSFTEVTVGSCTQLFAYGINNTGEIVGLCQNAAGSHAFFKAPTGEEAIYDAPGANTTQLNAINVDGYMAGSLQSAGDPVIHGVFTDSTIWTRVNVPGAKATQVWGLNASNVMAGYYDDAGNQVHGFTSPDGSSFDFLEVPGASATQAFGITTAGQVSGTYYVSGVGHGFLKDGASYTTIDSPGASFTAVRGISPDGTKLVGAFVDASGRLHGFLATTKATDTTPPVVTVAVNPAELWPPSGQMRPVTVTGSITDTESGVDASTASYTVLDEYGLIQPTGPVSLQPNGSYRFTVSLQASRRGSDADGRPLHDYRQCQGPGRELGGRHGGGGGPPRLRSPLGPGILTNAAHHWQQFPERRSAGAGCALLSTHKPAILQAGRRQLPITHQFGPLKG